MRRYKHKIDFKRVLFWIGIGLIIYSGFQIYQILQDEFRYLGMTTIVGLLLFGMIDEMMTWLGVGLIVVSKVMYKRKRF